MYMSVQAFQRLYVPLCACRPMTIFVYLSAWFLYVNLETSKRQLWRIYVARRKFRGLRYLRGGGGSIALNWIVLTFLFFQQNNGFIWCGSEPVTVTPSINTTMLSRDPASMTQPMTSPTSASLLDVSICSGGQRITCNLSHRVYKRHSELLYW